MTITARDLITLALKQAGILGVGQTALAEDINDCFTLLQQMVGQWQKRRWLVPALVDISTIGNGNKSNTIGIGGYWNVTRPSDIKGGYVLQLNTGATPVSLPLTKIFSYEEYIQIAIKNLTTLPSHFFYDNAWAGGLGNIFIWPIPTSAYECHLLIEAQLGWPLPATTPPTPNTGLDTVFSLPLEYQEALFYNLALRISEMYQFPASAGTMKLAKTSVNTIISANTQVPKMSMPPTLKRGKSFNIFNADGY